MSESRDPVDRARDDLAHDELASLAERALRGLPRASAPPGLEARVIAELQRRAAHPWWRHSFGHWPPAARLGFLALCVALIALVTLGPLSGIAAGLVVPHAAPAFAVVLSMNEVAILLTHAIPASWLYGALFITASLYAALLGLGSAAYQTLYQVPLDRR